MENIDIDAQIEKLSQITRHNGNDTYKTLLMLMFMCN
jgi:hypothetical protein